MTRCILCENNQSGKCPGCKLQVCFRLECYSKHYIDCAHLRNPICSVCGTKNHSLCPSCWKNVCGQMGDDCFRKHDGICVSKHRYHWMKFPVYADDPNRKPGDVRLRAADLIPKKVEVTPAFIRAADRFGVDEQVAIVSFALAGTRPIMLIEMSEGIIHTPCPLDCGSAIEFDGLELERLFAGNDAFKTSCPRCNRPLGLIKSLEKSFKLGAL